MDLSHLPRIWRTTQHLQWSQVAYRVQRLVRNRLDTTKKLRFDSANHADLQPINACDFPTVPIGEPAEIDFSALVSQLSQGKFQHLNRKVELGDEAPDWRLGPQTADRLWTITLHYHRWLFELSARANENSADGLQANILIKKYLGDWLSRCDLLESGAEHLAWNSYAIATRIPWWVRSYFALEQQSKMQSLRQQMVTSLAKQANYLAENLEWDLRANHLLRDAVGLAWAGRFFQGDEAERWLATATELGLAQAQEQVLADGGHFERSPHYHREVMHDLLSLALLVKSETAAEVLRSCCEKMSEYSAWLRHPDGFAPQFNDGRRTDLTFAFNHANDDVAANADTRPQGGKHFKNTGIISWHGNPWTVFFDVGEIGPKYQPGHAHADSLNIECSYLDQRLFVDPGCFNYDNDARRSLDRATSSHNTVCIDGQDSSEMWHIFRVGRRAKPLDVETQFDGDSLRAIAAHTGYDHLPGAPRHQRQLVVNSQSLIVRDQITGSGNHQVSGGWLLEPGWSARHCENGWVLTHGKHQICLTIHSEKNITLHAEQAVVHPDYHVEQLTTRLVWRYEGSLPLQVKTQIQSGDRPL